MMLESNAYRVAVAPDGDEVLAGIDDMARWDSGFQFLWKLNTDDRYEEIAVFMVTAVDTETGVDFARHANVAFRTADDEAYLAADGYIEPVKTDQFLRAVEPILRRVAKQTSPK